MITNNQQIEKNEVFELAFRFITETSENIFLTGKAGTGKTTFLKYLHANSSKIMVIAAPTGVAAINAGGVTLHSLFQLPFHPFLPNTANRENLLATIRITKQRQQLLRSMELLVIDEISMVRCDVIDAIDAILRSIRRNYQQPFGGVQLVCIGDLYQLPPVAQTHEWSLLQEYYASPFFFDSLAVREQPPLLIELDKIYRQKEDSFVRLLNRIRNNEMDEDDFEDLNLRLKENFNPADDDHYITLASHNKQADETNSRKLNQIISPAYTYSAEIENDFPENLFPVEEKLVLKVGAQVMFLKNDPIQKRYYNGKIGIVTKLEEESIIVECDTIEIAVQREVWENSKYNVNKANGKLEQDVIGTFSQYPLRLAWAITIHKSQGLTFEKVMIDAGSAFSSGQVYVALSRCTSLEGIVLLTKIPPKAIYSNDNVVKGQESLMHKGSLVERFMGARNIFTQQILETIFSFKDLQKKTNELKIKFNQYQSLLNSDAKNWISDLDSSIQQNSLVGEKFNSQIIQLMKENDTVEENNLLQCRLKDAANYFEPKLNSTLSSLLRQPISTEYKEVATAINEILNEIYWSLHKSHYFIDFCKQDFNLTSFLKHKLNYVLPKANLNTYASKQNDMGVIADQSDLYNTLKRWRDMVCEETGLAIYMVANQATLKEIVTYLPHTKNDLLRISGFGKAKVEKYGDDIIDVIKDYCDLHSLTSNMEAKPVDEKSKKVSKSKKEKSVSEKKDTKTISLEMFQDGKSIDEIARERNLTKSTIENHFIVFIEKGEVQIEDFLNSVLQQKIEKAINIHGKEDIKTLMQNFLPDVGYNPIKMVIAHLKYLEEQKS